VLQRAQPAGVTPEAALAALLSFYQHLALGLREQGVVEGPRGMQDTLGLLAGERHAAGDFDLRGIPVVDSNVVVVTESVRPAPEKDVGKCGPGEPPSRPCFVPDASGGPCIMT